MTYDAYDNPLTIVKQAGNVLTETFTYDVLNRIVKRNGSALNTYDAKGNILMYGPVGHFDYNNSARPYAVTRAYTYNNSVPEANQVLSFNALGRVSSLRQDVGKSATFLYDEDGDRMEMAQKDSLKNLTKTNYYIGDV